MATPLIVDGVEGATSLVGKELGPSDWVEITQERVDLFAAATGDHQWIHVDVERAKEEARSAGPIAHGYLTLSLLPGLGRRCSRSTASQMGVNYGADKVRFPAPGAGRQPGCASRQSSTRSTRSPGASRCRPAPPSRSRAAPSRRASRSSWCVSTSDVPPSRPPDRGSRRRVTSGPATRSDCGSRAGRTCARQALTLVCVHSNVACDMQPFVRIAHNR